MPDNVRLITTLVIGSLFALERMQVKALKLENAELRANLRTSVAQSKYLANMIDESNIHVDEFDIIALSNM
jgi:hypothetical protein